jgi:hypothetical protein
MSGDRGQRDGCRIAGRAWMAVCAHRESCRAPAQSHCFC